MEVKLQPMKLLKQSQDAKREPGKMYNVIVICWRLEPKAVLLGYFLLLFPHLYQSLLESFLTVWPPPSLT